MKKTSYRIAFCVSLSILAAAGAGCGQSNNVRSNTVAADAAKPAPEKSFEHIVETFRRGVEDIPIGFVLRDGNGHTMMTGKNEVSHKLMPPANAGDTYKATITVTSQSRYSIQRAPNGVEESDEQQAADVAATEDASGVDILDPDLVSTPAAAHKLPRSTADSTDQQLIARRPDKMERNYDLVYQNGKWVLTTELNPETEQSIINAFDQALKTQG